MFLGLDPALHTSGAGLLVPDYGGMNDPKHAFDGTYVLSEFGKVTSQRERKRYIESLLDASDEHKLPAVVIAEEWDGPHDRRVRLSDGSWTFVRDPRWTYTTILRMGEGWGLWSAEIQAANEYLQDEGRPEIVLQRVLTNAWRDTLFGVRRAKDSDAEKATARRYFESVFGYQASSDISEAGCIALFGTTAPAVAEALASREAPAKRRRKKSA